MMRAFDAQVSVDPVLVNGQAQGEGAIIAGDAPPAPSRNWWPWILGGALLAGLWWLTKDEEGGGRSDRPFVG